MAATSYADIFQGLQDRFTAAGITNVLRGEPQSIQTTPAVYSLFYSVDNPHGVSVAAATSATTWTTQHTLCIAWVDPDQSEAQLHQWLDLLPAALVADPDLGGVLTDGIITVTRGEGTFQVIGGTLYRVVDLYTEVAVFE